MAEAPAQATPATPARLAVSVSGNRCVVQSAPGVRERVGFELASAVGKPRLAALLVEEGVSAEGAQEIHRLLVDAGFRVFDLALPAQSAALTLECALDLARECAGMGLTPDDALCVIGGAEALSAASWLAGNWGSKAALAAIPTTLEALIRTTSTPVNLTAGATRELVATPPAIRSLLADEEFIAREAKETSNSRSMALALMVQAAMVESAKAFDAVCAFSEAFAAGDGTGLVDQALETARARGRLANATLAASRASLAYGMALARALESRLGAEAPKGAYLAEGLRFEARLAWQRSGLDADVVFAQDQLLARLGLAEVRLSLTPEELLEAMKSTTALLTNRRRFILLRAVGRAQPEPVDDEVLLEHLSAFCQARRPA